MRQAYPEKHVSLWIDTSVAPTYPALLQSPKQVFDVAVIGGGIAGVTTAFFLQQAGKKVVLLEASRICLGVTGRTTAHVTIAHNLIYQELEKTFGEEGARMYARANTTGLETIAQLVESHQLDCDFQRVSEFLFAENVEARDRLKKELEVVHKLEIDAHFRETAPLPFSTMGAIEYPHQAQFHPRKYILSLTEQFVKLGGQVFEQTRVQDVKEAEPCSVQTQHAELKASKVVVATHFPILDRGLFYTRMTPHRSYVIGARLKDEFPDSMYDTAEDPSHYIRTQRTAKGRVVIIGGEDHQTGADVDTQQHYLRLEEYIRRNFTVERIEYSWSTQDNYTFDQVPFIGKYTPTSEHLFVATGFNGWGMTTGTVAGLLLKDMILGKANSWEKLFSPLRLKLLKEVPQAASNAVHQVKNLVGEKLKKRPALPEVDLKPGTAQIIEEQGHKFAMYKDRKGKVHAVSAECAHLGCLVRFNQAETSWDCPCHGSRYTVDGEVLHSPTVRPLDKLK